MEAAHIVIDNREPREPVVLKWELCVVDPVRPDPQSGD